VAFGNTSSNLGNRLAELLKAPVIDVQTKVFPDGEGCLRIQGDPYGKKVLLVHSMYPEPDKRLTELLLMAHKLNEEGAQVYAIVPYLAYARQHRVHLEGEVVSLGVVGHLLRTVGIKRVVTLDIHNVEGLGLIPIPTYSVSVLPSLAEYLDKKYDLNKPLCISPDIGSSIRAEAFSKILKADTLSLDKRRDRDSGEVAIDKKKLDVEDRDIVIVDDIIATGNTIQKAMSVLKEACCGRVIAVCTHSLLVGDALQNLESAGVSEVVGTNSVPNPMAKVDVLPSLYSHIKTLS
ncbi:MAG: ribose-phosphate diphosphokinase, partial [Nitrososphaerales archaeon]